IPSTVVISCPSQLAAKSVQDNIGVPSTITVQAPHEESSQPRLEPVMRRSSRNASSNNLLGCIAISCARPLTTSSTNSFFIDPRSTRRLCRVSFREQQQEAHGRR